MIGTPSIYYGDEAEIDGWTETIEGCASRCPGAVTLSRRRCTASTAMLIRARNEHPALTDGMTCLYADGPVIAFARLGKDEAVVTAVSSSQR